MKLNELTTSQIMNEPFETFTDLEGAVTWYPNDQWQRHIHIDNGSGILFVAHMDTVINGAVEPKVIDNTLYHPHVDDRWGIVMALELSQRTGIEFDWLFTDNEESGNSTGQFFEPAKQYNWAFMFDRNGTDAALYHHYDDDDWRRELERAGWETSSGLFTCITSMDIGCAAVNFGCGYHANHSKNAYVKLSQAEGCLAKAERFLIRNQDEFWPAQSQPYARYTVTTRRLSDDYYDWYQLKYGYENPDDGYVCDGCGHDFKIKSLAKYSPELDMVLCVQCQSSARKSLKVDDFIDPIWPEEDEEHDTDTCYVCGEIGMDILQDGIGEEPALCETCARHMGAVVDWVEQKYYLDYGQYVASEQGEQQ